MSRIIGITGPTGSGKSIATTVAQEKGFNVIDCDVVARQAVLPKSEGLRAIVSSFGDSVLLPDGSLNRRALADLAFGSKENTELLNKTILPYIVSIVKSKLDKSRTNILDAPTLFESRLSEICTATVAILADEDQRYNRIILRDNITESQARIRMSAGKDDDFYIKRADYIIINNGDVNTFKEKISKTLDKIIGGSGNE